MRQPPEEAASARPKQELEEEASAKSSTGDSQRADPTAVHIVKWTVERSIWANKMFGECKSAGLKAMGVALFQLKQKRVSHGSLWRP